MITADKASRAPAPSRGTFVLAATARFGASRRDCALASFAAVMTSYVLAITSATVDSSPNSSSARSTVAGIGGGNSPAASTHACRILLAGARDFAARIPSS